MKEETKETIKGWIIFSIFVNGIFAFFWETIFVICYIIKYFYPNF